MLPQPVSPDVKTQRPVKTRKLPITRRRLERNANKPNPKTPGKVQATSTLPYRELLSSRAWVPPNKGEPVSTVRLTVWTPPADSSIWSLEKVQVAFSGRPRQPNEKVSVKFLTDASVSWMEACCLVCICQEFGVASRLKS